MKQLLIQVSFVVNVPDDTHTGNVFLGDILQENVKLKPGFEMVNYATDNCVDITEEK